MKYTLPCYSYDDVNGYSYFVYYLPDGLSCELLSLRSWGNDFAPLRRIYGFFTQNRVIKWLPKVGNIAFLYIIYKMVYLSTIYFLHLNDLIVPTRGGEKHPGWIALMIASYIVLGAVVIAWFNGFSRSIYRYITRTVIS